MKVVIAGGGTAGHVFPAVALAQRLRDRGVECRFVGSRRGLERDLVPSAGFEITLLDIRQFPRRPSWDLVRAPAALVAASRTCGPLVADADAVVGMGGYASAPAVVAAWRKRRPVVLHEQNAIPGAANRYLSRTSRVVALSFAEAAARFPRSVETAFTGNPVRAEVAAVRRDRDRLRAEGLERLNLDPSRRTILVFGGSQGAVHLNQAAVEMCRSLAERGDLQVLLLAGRAHADVLTALPAVPLRVRALPFLERMELAYAAADLIVCRAGATSIAELTVCGLPALLIPYPHATANHQDANARALEHAGGAEVISDAALSGEVLAGRVAGLLADGGALERMAERSAAWGNPSAAEAVADLVLTEATR